MILSVNLPVIVFTPSVASNTRVSRTPTSRQSDTRTDPNRKMREAVINTNKNGFNGLSQLKFQEHGKRCTRTVKQKFYFPYFRGIPLFKFVNVDFIIIIIIISR